MSVSAFVLAILFFRAAEADYSLDISQVNEVTHLEIPEIVATDYQLKNKGSEVELLVSGLNAKAIDKLQRYSDQHIKKITVTKSSSLSKDIVTVYLKGKNTQVFDYLTDAPSALSIDFYIDDNAEPAQAKSEDSKKNAGRAPASDEFLKAVSPLIEIVDKNGKKIGDDTKKQKKAEYYEIVSSILDFDLSRLRFKTDSIIETRGKIFIKFPVLLNENPQLNELVNRKVFYQVEESEDPETKDMLLVKELFKKNDYKNFLRSKEIIVRKYPKSKFLEMLMFMEGDALYELSKEEKNSTLLEQALKVYDATVTRFPQSPLTERTILFMASLRINKGEYLGAIRNLKTYVTKYDKSPLRDNMEMYLAHCLLRVKQNEEALNIFERLMKSSDEDVKRQATFEVGDAYFERKDYKKAINFYDAAIAEYPAYRKDYANAYFNKAEALFVEEQYKESLESFKEFLKYYPQHPFASYVWTRMGEIFEISDEKDKKYLGYYKEGNFRFKNTNGGAISQIHFLSNQMTETESRRIPQLLSDMRTLEKNITLPQADEFLAFSISDAYFNRKMYLEATEELVTFFKIAKIPVYADKFHRRIGRGISFQIREELAKNNVDGAFKIFDKYDQLWFKKSERLDFAFLKGQALEKTKAYKNALKEYTAFNEKFKKLSNQEEITIIEKLPPKEELYLRMANCNYALKDLTAAREWMSKVDTTKLTPDLQDESMLLLGKINDVGGEPEASEKYLSQIKKLNFEGLMLTVKVLQDQKKYQKALDASDDFLEKNKLSATDKFQLLKTKLSVMEKIALDEKYYKFSERFYDEYKKTNYVFDAEKYKLGLHYAELDKMKDAEEVWSTIQPDTMWKRLAEESSKEKKFNGQYKKYIERIPAMAEPKQENK